MSNDPQSNAGDFSNPTEDQVVEAIVKYAAFLLRDGKSRDQIESALLAKSVPPDFAKHVADGLCRARASAVRQLGLKHMGIGAAWCIGGAAVTYFTMVNAKGGGTYVVAWGAIIFGGLEFLWGLWKTLTG